MPAPEPGLRPTERTGAEPIRDDERAAAFSLLPLLVTFAFYLLPHSIQASLVVQFLPQVVAYLEQAPTPDEIRRLLGLLGLADARALMRKGEAEYTELGLDAPALGQDALIAAMAAHPRLIERPIVVHGDKAVIGRPPEKVLAIL